MVPIFDQVTSVDSVGAIQVAPSDPDIVYAGAGDPIGGSLGNGMWKSTDAGKTWQHIGLENTVKIDSILVDPNDPNLVIASTLGDATHDGGGIYRSTDGGQTWTNVLEARRLRRHARSGVRVRRTQRHAGRHARHGRRFRLRHGQRRHSAQRLKPPLVFKSTDEGLTWTEIKIPAFPGRVGVAIAMHTSGQRMYIVGNNIENGSGLFRSDDGGDTWQHMAGKDTRISNGQGAYSCGVFVDSQNPDILYTVSTAMYRSTDGGVTFDAFKGAPGGEDYHKLWIDPTNGKRMVVGADQGASVTLDGGEHLEPLVHAADQPGLPRQYRQPVSLLDRDFAAGYRRGHGQQPRHMGPDQLLLTGARCPPLNSASSRLIPKNPHILYAVGYGPGGGGSGLVKINMSTGNGRTWRPTSALMPQSTAQGRDFQKKFDTRLRSQRPVRCLPVPAGVARWRPFLEAHSARPHHGEGRAFGGLRHAGSRRSQQRRGTATCGAAGAACIHQRLLYLQG